MSMTRQPDFFVFAQQHKVHLEKALLCSRTKKHHSIISEEIKQMLTLQLEFQFFHLDSTFGQSHFTSLGSVCSLAK